MNLLKTLAAAVLAAAPLCAQFKAPPAPQPFQVPQAPQVPQLPQLPQVPQAAPFAYADSMAAYADSMLAFADSTLSAVGLGFQQKLATGRLDGDYDRGMRALDDHKYDEAVRLFDSVINGKGSRADGALYWKAYALNRLGRRDDSLAALTQLRRDYAGSHWLNDAQALEAEVRQGSGQPVSPQQEANDDIKLLALNGLMNQDPERAIPAIEGILKGSSSPKVKDRALFVLTQSQSPQAQQLLMNYAKGAGNPDLQMRAVRYIGMSGTTDARKQLLAIYNGSSDATVKHQIIQSFLMSNDKDDLVNIAKNEKDQDLRLSAIRQLGAMHGVDQLTQMYAAESSPEIKKEIIRSLFVAGASDKLLEIVRNEKDQAVRSEALRNLAMTNGVSADVLAGLYTSETDQRVKRQLINGLFARGDGKAMVDIARKETDPAMKKFIIQQLSVMHSKEGTDYLMELLK